MCPNNDDPTIRPFLDISTAHVSLETRDWLNARGQETAQHSLNTTEAHPTQWVGFTPYGWFVFAPDEDGSGEIPADLFAVMTYARSRGADYIMFDRDAPTVEDLPLFEEVA